MKTLKLVIIELVLPFILCWFFMSVLVDIVTIPTVFRNISNMQEAGKIGMTVFGRFNCFEIFFGFCVLAGTLLMKKKSTLMISISVFLLALSIFYTFYMTPLIASNSVALHSVANTDPRYEAFQKTHNLYHNLYRYFDTAKLIVLLAFAGLVVRYNISKRIKESV